MGVGRRKQLNLGEKQKSLYRNNRGKGGGGEGGKEEWERPTPKPYLGVGVGFSTAQVPILGRKLLATTLMLP